MAVHRYMKEGGMAAKLATKGLAGIAPGESRGMCNMYTFVLEARNLGLVSFCPQSA